MVESSRIKSESRRKRQPGTIIKETLLAWWIKAYGGCGCEDLAIEMDSVGPYTVLEKLDEYTDRMSVSISNWRAERLRTRIVPQPPREVVYDFIKWAANKSIAESQL